MRIAGAAAVGGVAALAAGRTAAADDGVGLIGGTPTIAADPVRTRYTGAAGNIGYLFESGTASASNATVYPSVIGAWAKNTGGPVNGVYAFSELGSGAGVFGEATGTNGVGLIGSGTKSGVEGRNSAIDGTGVQGIGSGLRGVGVRGRGATGVEGTSVGGPGVSGESSGNHGVVGTTRYEDSAGVYGISHATAGTGAVGYCETPGSTGVLGFGQLTGGNFQSIWGVAVTATTLRAHLLLVPQGAAPPTRTEAYATGEVVVDAPGDFWVCVAAGMPGTWRKLAGYSTAGAFHAIEPARVYDSRLPMTPTANGTLATGQARVIPVADRRNLTTGVVTAANVVPAGATAVAYNVTVTQTSGRGFAYIAPGDATEISASTINWSAENTASIANAAVVKLDGSRRLKVFVGGVAASTQFIIDITGYYR